MREKLRIWFIEILGGFANVQDALKSVSTDAERNAILSEAVKRLYNTIGADDILRETTTGEWTVAGKPLIPGRKEQLMAEATEFLESGLWTALQADVKYQANRIMFNKAKTETDIVAGKLWTLTLDVFKTRLKSLHLGSGAFNRKRKG